MADWLNVNLQVHFEAKFIKSFENFEKLKTSLLTLKGQRKTQGFGDFIWSTSQKSFEKKPGSEEKYNLCYTLYKSVIVSE